MYIEKIVSSLTTTKNESYSCLHRHSQNNYIEDIDIQLCKIVVLR